MQSLVVEGEQEGFDLQWRLILDNDAEPTTRPTTRVTRFAVTAEYDPPFDVVFGSESFTAGRKGRWNLSARQLMSICSL
jgi:hypothetical protein